MKSIKQVEFSETALMAFVLNAILERVNKQANYFSPLKWILAK